LPKLKLAGQFINNPTNSINQQNARICLVLSLQPAYCLFETDEYKTYLQSNQQINEINQINQILNQINQNQINVNQFKS
jgi:hypothetical protein